MFNISHFVGRRKFLRDTPWKTFAAKHSLFPTTAVNDSLGDDYTRKRNSSRIRRKSRRVCINARTYLLLYPELTRARSLPFPPPSPLIPVKSLDARSPSHAERAKETREQNGSELVQRSRPLPAVRARDEQCKLARRGRTGEWGRRRGGRGTMTRSTWKAI